MEILHHGGNLDRRVILPRPFEPQVAEFLNHLHIALSPSGRRPNMCMPPNQFECCLTLAQILLWALLHYLLEAGILIGELLCL